MFFKEKKPPLTLFIHNVRGDFVHGEFNRTVGIQEVLDVLHEFREMGVEFNHPFLGHHVILDIKDYDGSRGTIRKGEWFNWKLRSEDEN